MLCRHPAITDVRSMRPSTVDRTMTVLVPVLAGRDTLDHLRFGSRNVSDFKFHVRGSRQRSGSQLEVVVSLKSVHRNGSRSKSLTSTKRASPRLHDRVEKVRCCSFFA
jgi:hypothetical protein